MLKEIASQLLTGFVEAFLQITPKDVANVKKGVAEIKNVATEYRNQVVNDLKPQQPKKGQKQS